VITDRVLVFFGPFGATAAALVANPTAVVDGVAPVPTDGASILEHRFS
jgi:hypothetical protein